MWVLHYDVFTTMPYASQGYLELSSACREIESGFRENKEIEFDDPPAPHSSSGRLLVFTSVSPA